MTLSALVAIVVVSSSVAEPLSAPQRSYLDYSTRSHRWGSQVTFPPRRSGRCESGKHLQFNTRCDPRSCVVGRFTTLRDCYVRKIGDESALIALPQGKVPATGDDPPQLALHGIDAGRLRSGLHRELTFDETFVRDGEERSWAGRVKRYVAVDRDALNRIAAGVLEPEGYALWTANDGTQLWAKVIAIKPTALFELLDGQRVAIDPKRFSEADRLRLHARRWNFNQPLPGLAAQ